MRIQQEMNEYRTCVIYTQQKSFYWKEQNYVICRKMDASRDNHSRKLDQTQKEKICLFSSEGPRIYTIKNHSCMKGMTVEARLSRGNEGY